MNQRCSQSTVISILGHKIEIVKDKKAMKLPDHSEVS